MSGEQWDGIDRDRVEVEPWWALLDERLAPWAAARREALSSRPGYDIDPGCYVATGAEVVASRLAIGARSYIATGCRIRGEVSIGTDTSLNAGASTIGMVTIGNRVRIATYVVLVGEDHVFDDLDRPIMDQGLTSIGVVIEDDVWLGAHVTVVDGVTIGAHSVIAAGAVVTTDVAPYSVMGGVPARRIRDRRGAVRSDALTRFDAMVQGQWPAVLERCRCAHGDVETYVDRPGGDTTDPRPLNDAIEIAGMFGAVPPVADPDQLIERIQATQDPVTGLFTDPRTGPPAAPLEPSSHEWHMYGLLSCGYALEVLGAGPAHPVHCIEACSSDELERLLGRLDMGYLAWPSGAWIDGFGTGLHLNRAHHGSTATAPALWGWLLAHQDPTSGMWGQHLERHGSYDFRWLMAVNGFYRLTRGTYAQFGVDVPRPEAAVDTLLTHCRDWDWFRVEERNACNVLDIVHPLWLLGQQTDHRRAEIRDGVASVLHGLLEDWVDGQGFPWQIGRDEPGLQGTEMFLAVIHLAADLLDESAGLSFTPRGVHRLPPASTLTEVG